MKVLISTSATARQQSNAKSVFGSKSVSILKALEEASKEKTLVTPGLDALLADLKLSETEFAKISGKASFTKAVAAAKSFASAKTFTAKIAALKAIKYSQAKVPAVKQTPGKVSDLGEAVQPTKLSKLQQMTEKLSRPASNLDDLYETLLDVSDGDLTTDTRLLTATIGKHSVNEIQAAADTDGQSGLVLGTPKHSVNILHRKDGSFLFQKISKLAGLPPKGFDFLICADKSEGGLFFSTRVSVIAGTVALFKESDSKPAFDHLKKLCR